MNNTKKLALFLSTILTFNAISLPIAQRSHAENNTDMVMTEKSIYSYEESLNLPIADIYKDGVKFEGTSFFSVKNPNSIEDYKKLGYTNIQYSDWSGTHMVVSRTKADRVAKVVVTNGIGFAVKSKLLSALIAVYDVSQALKDQKADIFPTVNARNIIATAPNGVETLIGEESIVKYYTDSKRTNLIKTIHRTNFVG